MRQLSDFLPLRHEQSRIGQRFAPFTDSKISTCALPVSPADDVAASDLNFSPRLVSYEFDVPEERGQPREAFVQPAGFLVAVASRCLRQSV